MCKTSYYFITAFLLPITTFALKGSGPARFLENKGQMADVQGKPAVDLFFKTSSNGVDLYVTGKGLSYVFNKIEKLEIPGLNDKNNAHRCSNKDGDEHLKISYCRADMELVGAKINKENILRELECEDRNDYYLGGICPDGVLNVRSFGKITIRNVYPGIDWVIYMDDVRRTSGQVVGSAKGISPGSLPDRQKSDGAVLNTNEYGSTTNDSRLNTNRDGIKYDFIVHPGADPSLIKLRYKWTDKPGLQKNGTLKINTPMGSIEEGIPRSFQETNPRHSIETNYSISGNDIQFITGEYNKAEPLDIDPQLVWATYYPGTNDYEDVSSMQDDGTNVWVTGSTLSAGFPTLNPFAGAYFQGTYVGIQNVFIIQFTTSGVRKWATYYGGTGEDLCNSIQSDGTNVWLTGQTTSADFPVLNPGNGAYFQTRVNPGGSCFVLQFSISGIRQWATIFGGTGKGGDVGNSIQSDGKNVWVTGNTTSPDFPTHNPGNGSTWFQGSYLGSSKGNAFILQFSTSGMCKWSTYYGGSGDDAGNSIQCDGSNVWLTGYTCSPDFPTFDPGAGNYFQGAPGGKKNYNAFILQFSTSGERKWATYYGGSSASYPGDEGNCIQSDSKYVWVTGSASSTDFPTLNPLTGAYYQKTPGVYGDAFILQFSLTGIPLWSTIYGGSGNATNKNEKGDIGYSIQSDGINLWVSGETSSSDFYTLSPGGGTFFQGGLAGKTDAFILQFTMAGVLNWATYYGNDTENDGTYISSDGKNLFLAGDIYNGNDPLADPGGPSYYAGTAETTGGHETVFMAEFCIYNTCAPPSCSLSGAAVSSSLSTICTGDSARISVSPLGETNVNYSWIPGGQTTPTIEINPDISTTYHVVLKDASILGCSQSASVSIRVNPAPDVSITTSVETIADGSSVNLKATGGGTYLWKSSEEIECGTCADITVSPKNSTVYCVRVTGENGCVDSACATIHVETPCGDIFIPTAFSPNSDGENDNECVLGMISGNCIESFHLTIFDRWGEKVFDTRNPTFCWDGKYRGRSMDMGVFSYFLSASLTNDKTVIKKGNITLVR